MFLRVAVIFEKLNYSRPTIRKVNIQDSPVTLVILTK